MSNVGDDVNGLSLAASGHLHFMVGVFSASIELAMKIANSSTGKERVDRPLTTPGHKPVQDLVNWSHL